jgi:glycosyltransferase involved in cell wall biosynthesis
MIDTADETKRFFSGLLDAPLVWQVGGEDVDARISFLRVLAQEGFRVGALGSGGARAFESAGIQFCAYPLERSVDPLADARSVATLTKHFRAGRPDIVHAFDTKPAIYAMIAAGLAKVPVRMRTVTGLGYLFSENDLRTRMLRAAYLVLHRLARRHVSWTVFQNCEDRDYFLAAGLSATHRVSVIRSSGIDPVAIAERTGTAAEIVALRRDLGLENRRIVLMASRLVVQKGVREFLDAARAIAATYKDVQFLLAGPMTGEGREAIPAAEVESAAHVVRALGRRSDLIRLMQMVDLFVLPSYYREGVPRVLLEAALVGCPLVTCDMPGCRDVVQDGVTGWLVPPRDGPALAATIGRALDSPPEIRASITERARRLVESEFSLQKIASDYAALYHRLLAEVRP